MLNRKKQQENDFQQEKKYQFIREQIRPQRRKQARNLLCWILATIGLACLAGGITSVVITGMQKGSQEKSASQATLLPEQSAEPDATNAPESSEKDVSNKSWMTLKKWNRLSEELSAVGTNAGGCVVGVSGKENAKDWFENKDNGKTVTYGMIIKENGTSFDILTSYDVLNGQSEVNVILENDVRTNAEILGSDAQLNLAVIRIAKAGINQDTLSKMTAAKMGNGLNLKKGTNVVAVGCPNGVLHSVVTGTITNDTVSASVTDGEVEMFITDMPYANAGNGVVLDLNEKVVGIITTEFKETTGTAGLSFINISSVREIIERLQKKETIPYLGCEGQTVSVAMANSHNVVAGAYITDVYSDSPAYKGGMRVADVITHIDGQEITAMSDIHQILLKHEKGDTIRCTISRKSGKNKVSKVLRVKLG
ncbi:MAG: PDZ domain-containing protein [Butyribacter sp.]|nr:PDZ domain-containing protein [bacterium]MDY3854069.1 PDZ domain-containing protein [Butyribacter sp.]